MSRYIDADKILYKDLSEGRGVCWVTFRDWIKEMPTADVVEVKHGEWIIQDGKVVCSECFEPNLETNFCPNCGAKMEGEEQ